MISRVVRANPHTKICTVVIVLFILLRIEAIQYGKAWPQHPEIKHWQFIKIILFPFGILLSAGGKPREPFVDTIYFCLPEYSSNLFSLAGIDLYRDHLEVSIICLNRRITFREVNGQVVSPVIIRRRGGFIRDRLDVSGLKWVSCPAGLIKHWILTTVIVHILIHRWSYVLLACSTFKSLRLIHQNNPVWGAG